MFAINTVKVVKNDPPWCVHVSRIFQPFFWFTKNTHKISDAGAGVCARLLNPNSVFLSEKYRRGDFIFLVSWWLWIYMKWIKFSFSPRPPRRFFKAPASQLWNTPRGTVRSLIYTEWIPAFYFSLEVKNMYPWTVPQRSSCLSKVDLRPYDRPFRVTQGFYIYIM